MSLYSVDAILLVLSLFQIKLQMEEISTVHTEHSKAVVDHVFGRAHHESDTNYPTIAHLVVQVIHSVWELIYGRLRLLQPIPSSLAITRLRPGQPPAREERSERHPTLYCHEPPDIPDPTPPSHRPYSTKEAHHSFTQRPMNEKFILKTSSLSSAQPVQLHQGAEDSNRQDETRHSR